MVVIQLFVLVWFYRKTKPVLGCVVHDIVMFYKKNVLPKAITIDPYNVNTPVEVVFKSQFVKTFY